MIDDDGSKKRPHAGADAVAAMSGRWHDILRNTFSAILLGVTCLGSAPASAQASLASQPQSEEVVGGNGKFDGSSTPQKNFMIVRRRNLDLSGKPCLVVSTIARSQALNKNIFNHILILDNHCGKEIRIRACYYKTTSCSDMSVGGYKRQQHVLGIFPYFDFQYSYREYVN